MNPRCSEPNLQMALLEDARTSGELTGACALHLDACPACQLEMERIRRMTEVWTADQADEQVIARAAARFHARELAPRASASWVDIVPYASAGIVAGCALLFTTGALGVPWKSGRTVDARANLPHQSSGASEHAIKAGAAITGAPRVAPVFASTDDAAKKVRARSHVETRRGVASLVDGMRLALSRGETVKVTLDDGHGSTIEGPCLVEFWSAPTEVGGWKIIREETQTNPNDPLPAGNAAHGPEATPASPAEGARQETPSASAPHGSGVPASAASPSPREAAKKSSASAATGGAAQALKDTVASSADEGSRSGASSGSVRAWARAASALREDNFDEADRAFDELCKAADPSTRDAARLARAQLWISRGREAAVRPILEQLAESGATPLIRQRAAETLHR
jgi:hypothetical protein